MPDVQHSTKHQDRPTSVYKYYDANKFLLYVGITRTATLRNQQHNKDKGWWMFVAEQAVEHFGSQELAHAREVELIQTFRPPFNSQHNPDHRDLRLAYIQLQQAGKLGMTLAQLVSTGTKRHIQLHHIAEDRDHTTFLTYAHDAPIAEALVHVGGVKVYAPPNAQYIGKVVAIKCKEKVAQIRTNVVLAPNERVRHATATVKYVSMKKPPLVELRQLTLVLEDVRSK